MGKNQGFEFRAALLELGLGSYSEILTSMIEEDVHHADWSRSDMQTVNELKALVRSRNKARDAEHFLWQVAASWGFEGGDESKMTRDQFRLLTELKATG